MSVLSNRSYQTISRWSSRAALTLAAFSTLNPTPLSRADEVYIPTPGMTLRSNSPACLNKFKSAYELLSSYFNGAPAYSSLSRLDVLTGGVPSATADAALPAGTPISTQLYAMTSTYGSKDGNLSARLGLTETKNGLDHEVSVQVAVRLASGYVAKMNAQYPNCESDSPATELDIYILKQWEAVDLYLNGGDKTRKFDGNLGLNFKAWAAPCKDPNKTIQQLVTSVQVSNPDQIKLMLGSNQVADSLINTDSKIDAYLSNPQFPNGYLSISEPIFSAQDVSYFYINGSLPETEGQSANFNKLEIYRYFNSKAVASQAPGFLNGIAPLLKNKNLTALCDAAE